jgi:hypothetical protein
MNHKLTLTLSKSVWDTIVVCIPDSAILNVSTMQDVIAFLEELRKARDAARPHMPEVVEEEEIDGEEEEIDPNLDPKSNW